MNKVIVMIALAAVMLSTCTGCAILDKDNRRTLNLLDENVQFESTGAKVAAAPLFIPVGLAAGLTDAVVVHPLASLPKAWENTSETVWENPKGSEFHQAMIFLPKVAVTPVVFTLIWTARAVFGIGS